MKQSTMRVEWYYGDFSDPEAVSGSSTRTLIGQPLWRLFLYKDFMTFRGDFHCGKLDEKL